MKNFRYLLVFGFCVYCMIAKSQTPTDEFMMHKGQICGGVTYQHDSWNKYWEGNLYRENKNLGTVTSQTVMPMFTLGIHDRINIIASLPWIKRAPSAGTLRSEQGFQDFSIWAKALLLDSKINDNNTLQVMTSFGFTTPVGNYYADYLPISLGMGVNSFNSRVVLSYKNSTGIFASLMGGYDLRSNLQTDRTNYYIDQHYLTGELYMPNVIFAGVKLGFINELTRAEISYTSMNTNGGFDIRRNDMPFPSNNMDMGGIQVLVQQRMPFYKPLGIILNAGYTTSGRNVGRTTSFGFGLLYLTELWK